MRHLRVSPHKPLPAADVRSSKSFTTSAVFYCGARIAASCGRYLLNFTVFLGFWGLIAASKINP